MFQSFGGGGRHNLTSTTPEPGVSCTRFFEDFLLLLFFFKVCKINFETKNAVIIEVENIFHATRATLNNMIVLCT